MKAIAILLGACLILSGCASLLQPNWSWYRSGATTADFDMDMGQCRAQAFSIPNAPLIQIAIVQQNCMIGKGWSKRYN